MSWKDAILSVYEGLVGLFCPHYCPGCGQVVGADPLCADCIRRLPLSGRYRMDYHYFRSVFDIDTKPYMGVCTSFLRYQVGGITQRLTHDVKFWGDKRLGRRMGELMAEQLLRERSLICEADLIIPVPLHPRRLQERGFNQAERLAKGLSDKLSIPMDTAHLIRVVHTLPQSLQDHARRYDNVSDAFAAVRPEDLAGKHVVIVDDVITTGATVWNCVKVLRDVPGICVSILAMGARIPGRPEKYSE